MNFLYLLFAVIHAAAILEEVVRNHNDSHSVFGGKNSFDKNQFGNMETPVDI